MDNKIIHEKQDLTHLKWSFFRHSSGTAGSFLKAYSDLDGVKKYYKISSYDSVRGIFGHECANEIIADRLLTLLGIEHVPYQLILADVIIEDEKYETYLCVSEDFKKIGEKKIAFDVFYQMNRKKNESPLSFCDRMGWRNQVDAMLLTDYLILNRDRHGANIEVLKNELSKSIRLAPLFDHGLSLIFSCITEEQAELFDVMEDKPVQSFVGSSSTFENLKLIQEAPDLHSLNEKDFEYLLYSLDDVLSRKHLDKIKEMIERRWCFYENMRDSR